MQSHRPSSNTTRGNTQHRLRVDRRTNATARQHKQSKLNVQRGRSSVSSGRASKAAPVADESQQQQHQHQQGETGEDVGRGKSGKEEQDVVSRMLHLLDRVETVSDPRLWEVSIAAAERLIPRLSRQRRARAAAAFAAVRERGVPAGNGNQRTHETRVAASAGAVAQPSENAWQGEEQSGACRSMAREGEMRGEGGERSDARATAKGERKEEHKSVDEGEGEFVEAVAGGHENSHDDSEEEENAEGQRGFGSAFSTNAPLPGVEHLRSLVEQQRREVRSSSSPTHPRTHSLTHSLTHPLTHSPLPCALV